MTLDDLEALLDNQAEKGSGTRMRLIRRCLRAEDDAQILLKALYEAADDGFCDIGLPSGLVDRVLDPKAGSVAFLDRLAKAMAEVPDDSNDDPAPDADFGSGE